MFEVGWTGTRIRIKDQGIKKVSGNDAKTKTKVRRRSEVKGQKESWGVRCEVWGRKPDGSVEWGVWRGGERLQCLLSITSHLTWHHMSTGHISVQSAVPVSTFCIIILIFVKFDCFLWNHSMINFPNTIDSTIPNVIKNSYISICWVTSLSSLLSHRDEMEWLLLLSLISRTLQITSGKYHLTRPWQLSLYQTGPS